MNEGFHKILENYLNEFNGFSIEGDIPITEEFLNELIEVYLKDNTPQSEVVPKTPASTEPGFDISKILNVLDKKELKIELREKVAYLKFKIKKY